MPHKDKSDKGSSSKKNSGGGGVITSAAKEQVKSGNPFAPPKVRKG